MSSVPTPPQPVDDPTGCDARCQRTPSGDGLTRARSPARNVATAAVLDAEKLPPPSPPQRVTKYLFFPVSVVGFPKGVSGASVVNFFREFGPVPGPGGVQFNNRPEGLEIVLIFANQDLATKAIGAIKNLDAIVAQTGASGTVPYKVALPSRLVAKIKKRDTQAAAILPPSALPLPSLGYCTPPTPRSLRSWLAGGKRNGPARTVHCWLQDAFPLSPGYRTLGFRRSVGHRAGAEARKFLFLFSVASPPNRLMRVLVSAVAL